MKHEPTLPSEWHDWLDEFEHLEYEDYITSRQKLEAFLRVLFKIELWDTEHQNVAYSIAREIMENYR